MCVSAVLVVDRFGRHVVGDASRIIAYDSFEGGSGLSKIEITDYAGASLTLHARSMNA